MARARAATQHLSHVSFQPTAIADIVLDEPVDEWHGRAPARPTQPIPAR